MDIPFVIKNVPNRKGINPLIQKKLELKYGWKGKLREYFDCGHNLISITISNDYWKWNSRNENIYNLPEIDFKDFILEPPYTITDIPTDYNIYAEICNKTGKNWGTYTFRKHFYVNCMHLHPREFLRLYIFKDSFLGWDWMENDDFQENFEINYKDFLSLFKLVKESSCSNCKYDKPLEMCYMRTMDKCHENNYPYWEPKEESWHGDKPLFINTKEIKMKKVVMEKPNPNPIISYRWLIENNACEEGLLWFVETFGNKTTWIEYKEYFEKRKIGLYLKEDYVYDDKGNKTLIFSYDWEKWVEDRLDFKNSDEDTVYIDDVNRNKLYFLKYLNNYHKIIQLSLNSWCTCVLTDNNIYTYEGTLKETIKRLIDSGRTIYEFDSFDDFVNAYKGGKFE